MIVGVVAIALLIIYFIIIGSNFICDYGINHSSSDITLTFDQFCDLYNAAPSKYELYSFCPVYCNGTHIGFSLIDFWRYHRWKKKITLKIEEEKRKHKQAVFLELTQSDIKHFS